MNKRTFLLAIFFPFFLPHLSVQATEGERVNMWAIDMTPLEVDGKYYAVWSGWRNNFENQKQKRDNSGQHLYIAEMTFHDEQPLVRLGKRVEISSFDTYKWENCNNHGILEGPQILRNPKTDDVFIIYSVNGSWSRDYCLAQIKLIKGANPMRPESWIKRDTPVFQGVTQDMNLGYEVFGVGHASFTVSPNGKEQWIYYHAKTKLKHGWPDRRGYLQKFTFDKNGDPQIGVPLPLKNTGERPAGERQIERKKYGNKKADKEFTNPIIPHREWADPWITKHNDMYYTVRIEADEVFVTESPFMTKFVDEKGNAISWEEARVNVGFKKAPEGSDGWNQTQFWAAELHNIDGKWYIFYAAGHNKKGPFYSQRAGVLVSIGTSAFGPYVEHDDKPLFTGENNYIQPTERD